MSVAAWQWGKVHEDLDFDASSKLKQYKSKFEFILLISCFESDICWYNLFAFSF